MLTNVTRLSRRQAIAAGILGTGGLTAGIGGLLSQFRDPSTLSQPVDGEWPSLRGDRQNTAATTIGGPTSNVQVGWERDNQSFSDSTPLVADGQLFIGRIGEPHTFVALDARTGQPQWETPLDDMDWTEQQILTPDGSIVVSAGTRVFSLDQKTGAINWETTFPDVRRVVGLVADDNGTVYVSTSKQVVALDGRDGTTIWNLPLGKPTYPAAILDESMVLGAYSQDSCELVAVSKHAGEVEWSVSIPEIPTSVPVVRDEMAYFTDNAGVTAVSLSEREIGWQFRPQAPEVAHRSHSLWRSFPAVSAERLFVGLKDERVYALDRKTGAVEWSFWAWEDVVSGPVVGAKTVYVTGGSGYLYALDTETGERRWEFETDSQVRGSGVALVDGTVFTSTIGGGVLALEEA